MKTEILLIRHGESESNRRHAFGGRTDIPLSDLGRRQAAVTAQFLRDRKIDAFFSSPLSRAYDTALAAAKLHGLPIRVEEDLIEISGGKWEELPFDEIARRFPEDYALWNESAGLSQCTGGEAVSVVQERVFACIRRLAEENPGKTLCMATHGMAIRAFVGKVLGYSLEGLKDVTWATNASVTTVEYEDGVFRLIRYSEDAHLEGLITTLPKTI